MEQQEIDLKKIEEILSRTRIIDLSKHEELPKEGWVVGLSNNHFGVDYLYEIKYSDHMPQRYTWGGYYKWKEEDEDYDGWWTMNHVYNDYREIRYAYSVQNKEDGKILAEFLNIVRGYIFSIQNLIIDKEEEIKVLKQDIEYFKNAAEVTKKFSVSSE